VAAEIKRAGWPMIQNLILDLNGHTIEIDNLVKVPDGVIALEVKTYSGFISGEEHNLYWTQHIAGKKHKFLNPMKQNLAHVKAVEEFLNDRHISVRGFVVTSGRARFATEIAHIPVKTDMLRRAILRAPFKTLVRRVHVDS
jgi:hypothetical protein